jgi:hypothetical protein
MDLREFAAIANVAAIPRLCEIIAIQPHCGSSRTLQVVFAEAPFESEEPVGTHRHVNSLNVAYASFTPASIASSVAASTLLASRGLPDTMRPFLLVSVLHRLPMGVIRVFPIRLPDGWGAQTNPTYTFAAANW